MSITKTHNEKKKLVPKIRFSEFKDSWDKKKLESICTRISDGIHSTPKYNEAGEYFFINGNNLINGSIIISEGTKTVIEEEFLKHKRELNTSTILLSINGTIGNIAFYNNEKVVLGKSAAYINLNNEENKNFIGFTLSIPSTQRYFYSELTGTTIKNLSLKTIKNLKVQYPTLPEQQKIAYFLSAVDEKIQQLTAKKNLLEQYKKGVMQKLFSGKIRFKDENGNDFPDWDWVGGNELFDNISDKKHNSDLPILAITQDQGAIPRKLINYKMTVTEASVASYKVVQKGDFIISLRTFQGGIEFSEYHGICSPAYNILRPSSKKVDTIFYKYYLKTSFYIRQLQKNLEGIRDGKMISYKYFSEIKVPFPSNPEQKKIATYLSSLDTKIETVNKRITQTQTFKKGLLQQMFV